jgi:hypothetical protein
MKFSGRLLLVVVCVVGLLCGELCGQQLSNTFVKAPAYTGYTSTAAAEAGTTATNITITGHGLSTGDLIVNTTRANATRSVTFVNVNNLTVASIAGQTTGDSIRMYRSKNLVGSFEVPHASLDDPLLDAIAIGGLWIRPPASPSVRNFESGLLVETYSNTIDKGRGIFINNAASRSDAMYIHNLGGGVGIGIESGDLVVPTTNSYGIAQQLDSVTSIGEYIYSGATSGGPRLLWLEQRATAAAEPAMRIDLTGNAAHVAQVIVNSGGNVGAIAHRIINGAGNILWQDSAQVAAVEFGNHSVANVPTWDFHSSGNAVDYDARIQVAGGAATDGQALVEYIASYLKIPRFQINDGLEPACAVAVRGFVVFVQGGAGVADTLRVCTKDGADAYGWRALF